MLWKCFAASWLILNISFYSAASTFSQKNITVGSHQIKVEIARTPQEHARGLMFRDKLGPDEGMLFIFDNAETRSFWMKNTLIDLSIGFFDKDGTLVEIIEMKSGKGVPDDILPSYQSKAPAKYALEMNRGWFALKKIKPGIKLKINP